MNPPGASVSDASGHGASAERARRLQIARARTPAPSTRSTTSRIRRPPTCRARRRRRPAPIAAPGRSRRRRLPAVALAKAGHLLKRYLSRTWIARTPSRQPIFLPCARLRGSKRIGSSRIEWPARSSFAVISGSMSKRFDSRLSDCAMSRVHHLVAGLHVGEPAAEQQVGHAGQHLVGENRQPRRVGAPGEEPRPVDDARAAVENRLHQLGQLRRIELEVGVLDRDDRAGGLREADADGAALAAVLLGVDDAQLRPLRRSGRAPRACRRSSRR